MTASPPSPSGPSGDRLAIGLSIAAALAWLPQAALIALAIGAIGTGGGLATGLMATAGLLAIGVVRSSLDAAGGRLAFRTARAALSHERDLAINALAARSPMDSDRPASGAAASVIAEQAEALVPYLARYRPARIKASVIPLAILACILPISWVAALVLIVAAPLIPIFMALIGWRAKAASEAQLQKLGDMNGFLLDRLRGLATIRAFDAVDRTAGRLRADAEDLRTRTMAVLKIAFLSSAVLELFSALGVAMVAVYIGFHLLGELPFGAWGGNLDLTQGLFILLLAPAFFEPLRELSAVWHDRAAGEAARDALRALSAGGTALPGAEAEGAAPLVLPIAARGAQIEISRLTFSHPGRTVPVFRDFDLAVRPAERIALLGPSGVGKSTLIALIAGLAPIDAGEIRIDGTILEAETAAVLRTRMAWIGQRPHIFAGTIRQNVSMGRPGVDAAAIDGALRAASLTEIAGLRPDMIGEGGIGLSGGEVVRLAIARAAASPGVRLILADEPTAHLDAETADRVTDALFAVAQNRTLILATHDPRLAARADRIVHFGPDRLEAAA